LPHTFYPLVEEGHTSSDKAPRKDSSRDESLTPTYPARVAVFDDAAAAPRVVVIDPSDVRTYLEAITSTVTNLSHEQGGTIPFMVIREVVENLIHAYFTEPSISILSGGDVIRFCDQGPGIAEKARALEYGTTSATDEMKRYIRGVGSGLPYVRQYMADKGGSLTIEDNICRGTIVTLSAHTKREGETGEPPHGAVARQASMPASPATDPSTGYAAMPVPAQASQQSTPSYAIPQGYAYPPAWYASQPYQPYAPQAAPPWPPTMPPQPQAIPPRENSADVAATEQPAPPATLIDVSERGRLALAYLATHDSVGPKDLSKLHGMSQPTWSRELDRLDQTGLTIRRKSEQKHTLTQAGQTYLSTMGMR